MKVRLVRCLALALSLAAFPPLQAEERHLIDSLAVQYAGMLGMISVGVENSVGKHATFQLLAGYTPESDAGVDIYSLGFKANYLFNPFAHNAYASSRLYGGMGIYYYFGEQYTDYKYPDGYYSNPYSQWHLFPYLGVKMTMHDVTQSNVTIYAEAGALDSYLVHYYNNYKTIGLSDVISLALGVSLPLR